MNNSNLQSVTGTVRVYLAPKFDEAGRALNFSEQRLMMIEMDKFTTTCMIFLYLFHKKIGGHSLDGNYFSRYNHVMLLQIIFVSNFVSCLICVSAGSEKRTEYDHKKLSRIDYNHPFRGNFP